MTLSSAEQYLLELMNRARLNPVAEAARLGIDLNKDLAPGTISGAAKQVLAPNAMLEAAATAHTIWMIEADVFSHTGAGGSGPGERIAAAGYNFSTWGENIAASFSSGTVTVASEIEGMNRNLFLSAGHRANLMTGAFREVGLGAETGPFTFGGTPYNSALLTEDFATSGSARFLTGVAYTDSNANHFYSMGEGTAGVSFTIGATTAQTAAAGGYALSAGSGAATQVSGLIGTKVFGFIIDMSLGNVKVDLVGTSILQSSGSITLRYGVHTVGLLGVAALKATGSASGDSLSGNAGNNQLSGLGGNDALQGNGGNDTLSGGAGADRLNGGAGNDILTGDGDADTFIYAKAGRNDHVTDFTLAQGDRINLDHLLWTGTKTAAEVVTQFAHLGTGEVLFDFGGGNQLHLDGLTSLTGLSAALTLF